MQQCRKNTIPVSVKRWIFPVLVFLVVGVDCAVHGEGVAAVFVCRRSGVGEVGVLVEGVGGVGGGEAALADLADGAI